MKISLAHDYLREYGGAEKVLESLSKIWSNAKIYTSTYEEDVMNKFGFDIPQDKINTTFMQNLPFRYKLRKHYFFIYPLAFNNLEIDSDVVLSSCSYASKFIKKQKNGLHVCYLHSVPKFLWDYETETPNLETLPIDKYLKSIYKIILPSAKRVLRKMDYSAAQKVDYFIANSEATRERIKKHYNQDSEVIYPPVEIDKLRGEVNDGGYFLVVSRLSKFKKIDIVVEAFNKLNKPLKIVGEGQELDNLKKISNLKIEFLGGLSKKTLIKILRNCTALIFPTHEDFGIVPVEAMAAGKPVLAFRGGGVLETVVEGVTGEFFNEQTSDSLVELLKKFDPSVYNAVDCRNQAKKFSEEEFKKKIKRFIEEKWENRK